MEIWKDIEGYKGIYQVSNFGRVKSFPKSWRTTNNATFISKERLLKVDSPHPSGYRFVTLIKNKVRKSHAVHRLVASAFIENHHHYPQVNHIDCDKANNTANNLEWCDNSHNQIHAFKHGLNKPKYGSDHPMSVLVVDISTGVFFDTKKDACLAMGITAKVLDRVTSRDKTNLRYV